MQWAQGNGGSHWTTALYPHVRVGCPAFTRSASGGYRSLTGQEGRVTAMGSEYMQIGEVAALTNLSLRTIRHYEEIGLVVPSGRSQGGFRLYVEADVQRLRLVRRMKPFFSLDETKDLLDLLERVTGPRAHRPDAATLDRVDMFRQAVLVQLESLREQVGHAEAFADELARVSATHGQRGV